MLFAVMVSGRPSGLNSKAEVLAAPDFRHLSELLMARRKPIAQLDNDPSVTAMRLAAEQGFTVYDGEVAARGVLMAQGWHLPNIPAGSTAAVECLPIWTR